jgi:septum formation protein
MLYLDGALMGKPASTDATRLGWRQMAGRSGRLYTGHCVILLRDNVVTYRASDSAVTTVRFGVPSPADLEAYVASGEPAAVAGGFTLDGLGGWFVDGVDGDPSSEFVSHRPEAFAIHDELRHCDLGLGQSE